MVALMIFSGQVISAEEIKLRVKAVKYESTPYLRNCESDCISFDSWHIYTVKVREVLSGEFELKKFRVAVLEHAARQLWYRKNWKISIKEFENKELAKKIGTDFVVTHQYTDEKDT